MKKSILIKSISFIFFIFLFSCNHDMKIEQANKEIQQYLDKSFGKLFSIDKIENDYNPDMFHEQSGYKVWLLDTAQIQFGPIFFQKNKYQHGWITYGGSDIRKDYKDALKETKNKKLPATTKKSL